MTVKLPYQNTLYSYTESPCLVPCSIIASNVCAYSERRNNTLIFMPTLEQHTIRVAVSWQSKSTHLNGTLPEGLSQLLDGVRTPLAVRANLLVLHRLEYDLNPHIVRSTQITTMTKITTFGKT